VPKHVADIQYAIQIFSYTCAFSWETKDIVAIGAWYGMLWRCLTLFHRNM